MIRVNVLSVRKILARPALYLLLLLLMLALATAIASGREADQPPARTRPPAAIGLDGRRLHPELGKPGAGRRPRAPEAPQFLSWARVAFQSAANDNWEIYLTGSDGNPEGLQRLTNHPADDLTPRLQRGGERIVFVSDRDGDSDIYLMRADGTGLRQLTNHPADDYRPAWSPDGSRIVFQSTRDGQSELYVMQADGSGLTRLTAHGAYDGLANWSPDGQQIVFASTRSGAWRIWVMASDGANPRQLSAQRFSENPVWSPDGSRIAYDADGDGDGWQELWLMDADGGNQHMIYDPGGEGTDGWVSSWSPDGNYIAFTRAQWVLYQDNWYWVEANLQYTSPGGGYDTMLVYGDANSNAHWQTLDISPPNSWLEPLPAYARGDVRLVWDGLDPGGAGINHWDIQRRTDDGPWHDWMMNVEPDEFVTSTWLEHDPGSSYAFRVRAVDQSLNSEPWPLNDQATTTVTFYSWAIGGHAYDNRGMPLRGVTAGGSSEAFEVWPSADGGGYRTYYAGSGDAFAPGWTREGFLSLPETTFPASSNRLLDVHLAPAGNTLDEWGFEGGDLPSTAWATGGLYSPTIITAAHTGAHAASLGLPFTWSEPASLYADVAGSENALVAAENGTLHVLIYGHAGGTGYIDYRERPAGGTWQPVQKVVATNSSIAFLQWALGPAGRIHVVWGGDDGLHHVWRDRQGDWSTPQTIGAQTSEPFESLFLVADEEGNAHLVWQTWDTQVAYYAHTNSEGSWSSPVAVGGDFYDVVDDFAAGAGRLHLLRTETGQSILYAYREAGGTWSAPEVVWPREHVRNVRLSVAANGTVHVIWFDDFYRELYHRQRSPDGRWSPARALFDGGNYFPDHRLDVAVDGAGRVYAVWPRDQDTCAGLTYMVLDEAGRWQGPSTIAMENYCPVQFWLKSDADSLVAVTSPYYSQANYLCRAILAPAASAFAGCLDYTADAEAVLLDVAIDDDHITHAVWQPSEGGVNYVENARVQAPGTSRLAQVVAVPETEHPTLSFLYRLEGATAAGGGLAVGVAGALSETTVYSTTSAAGPWTHRWVDLSPWSGETVTLTFKVAEVAGQPRTTLLLDEVTLAPAYPDSWVRLAAPSSAGAGEEVSLLVDYGNRGGVPLTGTTLALSLPPELTLVTAQPAPTTGLQWDLGSLPAGSSGRVVVTATFAAGVLPGELLPISATIAGDSELEMADNTAEASIVAGHLAYLPAIRVGNR